VLDLLRTAYVRRAASPGEENWDSDEERAVAVARVVGGEEEDQQLAG